MKAADMEPSASSLRNRLGAMLAVVKADMISPAPKVASWTESRRSPRTRETTVRNERTPMFLRLFDTQALALRPLQQQPGVVDAHIDKLCPGRGQVVRDRLPEEELALGVAPKEQEPLHGAAPDVEGLGV